LAKKGIKNYPIDKFLCLMYNFYKLIAPADKVQPDEQAPEAAGPLYIENKVISEMEKTVSAFKE